MYFRNFFCPFKRINKKLDLITDVLLLLVERGEIMASKFDQLVQDLNQATNDIAARIDALNAKITAGGLSQDEEDAIHAELTAVSERLKVLGADPQEPIPEPEPEPEEPIQ